MSWVLAIGHLPRVSFQSSNDKGDNEMIPGALHKPPGIYLTVEENPDKTSAMRMSDEGCVTSHRLK